MKDGAAKANGRWEGVGSEADESSLCSVGSGPLYSAPIDTNCDGT